MKPSKTPPPDMPSGAQKPITQPVGALAKVRARGLEEAAAREDPVDAERHADGRREDGTVHGGPAGAERHDETMATVIEELLRHSGGQGR